jgi:SAM-dependent methyltransferase
VETAEFARMAAVEDTMWWYQALHRHLLNALQRFVSKKHARLLDAGCGTGGFIRFLKEEAPTFSMDGIDASVEACELARERGCKEVEQASVNQLPFADGIYDGIISADVLYHRAVDPEKAMAEFRRCLKPGGILILQLPAYEWLRSYHDEQVHTRHRFTRKEVKALFEKNGFSALWSSYWNSLAFPLLLARRFLFPPQAGQSDVQNYAKPVEWLLSTFMRCEETYLKLGGRFGWGSSILAVGRKTP